MQAQFTIYHDLNKVLFKLSFYYPITTNIQTFVADSSTLNILIYEDIIQKVYTIYNFDNDKLYKITLKFKVLNDNSNSLLLQGLDITSEYPLNTTLRILDI